MRRYIVSLLALLSVFGAGCEQQGVIDVSDCRETIKLEDDSYEGYLRTFTCQYQKNQNGKVLSGTCFRVVTEGGKCRTVYVYSRNPEVSCSKDFPYADYDGKCYKTWDSYRVNAYSDKQTQ